MVSFVDMKKPILVGTIAIVAILIGISAIFVQNNDDAKINHIESPDNYSEKIAITTTTNVITDLVENIGGCLLYTSPSPRDLSTSRMPSSA